MEPISTQAFCPRFSLPSIAIVSVIVVIMPPESIDAIVKVFDVKECFHCHDYQTNEVCNVEDDVRDVPFGQSAAASSLISPSVVTGCYIDRCPAS